MTGIEGIFFSILILFVKTAEDEFVGREIFEDGIFFRRFRCG